jgi:hypothetical protein
MSPDHDRYRRPGPPPKKLILPMEEGYVIVDSRIIGARGGERGVLQNDFENAAFG